MKVLIVDDEPHLIHAIKALVPWQEYDIDKVLSATTAAEARELLSREQPQLAFFDIMIGDERGTDLMNYVVEQKISSKVIAISGYSDFEYVRSMLQSIPGRRTAGKTMTPGRCFIRSIT